MVVYQIEIYPNVPSKGCIKMPHWRKHMCDRKHRLGGSIRLWKRPLSNIDISSASANKYRMIGMIITQMAAG